jgi:hypothetical protein
MLVVDSVFTVEPIIVDDPADLAKALSREVLAGFDAFVLIADAVSALTWPSSSRWWASATNQEIEFDFVADNPGMTLFHCHQQLHVDFGFMTPFDYARRMDTTCDETV